MKLIAKVADKHSNAIMQVNKRCANCGVIRSQTQIHRIFFYFEGQCYIHQIGNLTITSKKLIASDRHHLTCGK